MANAPERIWAKLDRATVYMNGSSPLVARTREFNGAAEYVRYSDYAALEAQLAARTGGVKPLANLIHDALAFAVWAADEGLCPTDGPPAPEDFLYAYSTATGFENWDAIPRHVATILSALTAGGGDE